MERSADTRQAYLGRMAKAAEDGPRRAHLSCGNQAHAYAAMAGDKSALTQAHSPNLGIVTAYNDMLSAHQPFEHFPEKIKAAARAAGGTAQVAGGVPAMCDGVTQGQAGMELSLFSRDVIALAAGVSLSHNTFDATKTVFGDGLKDYTQEPKLKDGALIWEDGAGESLNEKILRPAQAPFQPSGGMKRLSGNLGTGVMKVSAVAPERHIVEAKARVFHDQADVKKAFQQGEFTEDTVVVVRFQGPKSNGMPELHSLTPTLAVLQDRGLKVALVTDGRMSGASGKVPSAIHVCPEAVDGGPLAQVRDGDMIRVDAANGKLDILQAGFEDRPVVAPDLSDNTHGTGRELFDLFRRSSGLASSGACALF
ncbi:UNVERIFIED_CONTAM: hypothetical protein GTU68_055377 [Idotea baltica]|nr:hypothetical protein [Idotea baltica]